MKTIQTGPGAALTNAGTDLSVTIATVVDYNPAMKKYLVALRGGGGVIDAAHIVTNTALVGTRSSVAIPVGAEVIVLVRPMSSHGSAFACIIGCAPMLVEDQTLIKGDVDALGASVGYKHDEVHTKSIDDARNAFYTKHNFNNFSPVDGLSGCDNLTNPFGTGMSVDNFFAYLKGHDGCGVWAFNEGLLRTVAEWLQNIGPGTHREEVDDNGEIRVVHDTALYPWEALGAFSFGEKVGKESEKPVVAEASKDTYPLETVEKLQRGIYRRRELSGYIGDIYQEFVGVPVMSELESKKLDVYGKNEKGFQGLYHKHVGSDGSLTYQSAKSITFEKLIAIPYPVEQYRHEEPEGDRAYKVQLGSTNEQPNYAASGIVANGGEASSNKEKHGRADYTYAKEEKENKTPYARAALNLELHGFLFSHAYRSLHAHEKDWSITEEKDVPLAKTLKGLNIEEFKLEQKKMWMKTPKYKELEIDHRFKKTRYYGTRSAFQMLDDGSIVIEDGYGSQIVMAGGNICITAANDVILAPGRNFVSMSGQDAIVRTGRSADITAGEGDVRIKAQKNLMLIQADKEEGGVLVDVRCEGSEYNYDEPGQKTNVSGLVMRSAKVFSLVAPEMSLISQSGGGAKSSERGLFVLQSDGDMHVMARNIHQDVEDSVVVSAGDVDIKRQGNLRERVGYVFGKKRCAIGVGTGDTPTIFMKGNASVDGTLSVTTLSSSNGVSEDGDPEAEKKINKARKDNDKITKEWQTNIQDIVSPKDERPNYFLAEGVMLKASASLRTEEDYGTDGEDGFVIAEWRWQQYAAQSGGTLTYWDEEPVEPLNLATPLKTLPYPGFTPWVEKESLATVGKGESFFDTAEGFAVAPEDGDVTEKTSSSVEKKTPSSAYIVNAKLTYSGS